MNALLNSLPKFIALNDRHQTGLMCQVLQCTDSELRLAVREVGNSRDELTVRIMRMKLHAHHPRRVSPSSSRAATGSGWGTVSAAR